MALRTRIKSVLMALALATSIGASVTAVAAYSYGNKAEGKVSDLAVVETSTGTATRIFQFTLNSVTPTGTQAACRAGKYQYYTTDPATYSSLVAAKLAGKKVTVWGEGVCPEWTCDQYEKIAMINIHD